MRKGVLLFLPFLFFSALCAQQVSLPRSINIPGLPNDSQRISTCTPYIDTTGLFMNSGFFPGDTAADFTLYDTLGNPTTLSVVLGQGKPVLLAAISLSCPYSRHSMEIVMPSIYHQFHSQVNIFVIYVLEAHPIAPDPSPYSYGIWPLGINY